MGEIRNRATKEDALSSLAKQLAGQNLSQNEIETLRDRLLESKHPITRVDICTMGICIDLEVDKPVEKLDFEEILKPFRDNIGNIEIFPHGITVNEGSLVRVSQIIERR